MAGELLLVRNASRVLTLAGRAGPQRGPSLAELRPVDDGALLIRDGAIVAVGSLDAVTHGLSTADQPEELDAGGGLVMPGFVDPHTHLVFAGTRVEEFEAR